MPSGSVGKPEGLSNELTSNAPTKSLTGSASVAGRDPP